MVIDEFHNLSINDIHDDILEVEDDLEDFQELENVNLEVEEELDSEEEIDVEEFEDELEEDKSIEDKNVAPRSAPMPPGIASFLSILVSTLSACQCETPETNVVPISAACTAADATAADAPSVSKSVELVNPKPIPSVPSMS
jgi:hypothetical protein